MRIREPGPPGHCRQVPLQEDVAWRRTAVMAEVPSGGACIVSREAGLGPVLEAQQADPGIQILPIIGQIEGHNLLPKEYKATKYEQLLPMLAAIEIDPAAKGLLVILNTPGGDVEAGLAIAEMIAGLSKPTVSLIAGGGHSIGLPIAVAARRSVAAPSASITIHPIRSYGVMVGVPEIGVELAKVTDRIVAFVSAHSHITQERYRELMTAREDMVGDLGTVLDAQRAVSEGLLDEVGGVGNALRALRGMIDSGGV